MSKNEEKYKKKYLSLLAAAVAVGCGKGFEGDLSGSGNIIGVDVSMASDNATRVTIISEAKNISSVGLYGFFAADDSYDKERLIVQAL